MFGCRLQYCRKKKGLSQQALAEMINVSVRTITFWEAEERRPPIEKLEWLADFFGVTTDYILGRTDIPNVYQQNGLGLSNDHAGVLPTTQKALGAQERKKSNEPNLSVGENDSQNNEALEKFIRSVVRQELSEADFVENDFTFGEQTTQAKMVARGGVGERSFQVSKTVAEAFENLPSDENQDGL